LEVLREEGIDGAGHSLLHAPGRHGRSSPLSRLHGVTAEQMRRGWEMTARIGKTLWR
jgi:hypothetical protein